MNSYVDLNDNDYVSIYKHVSGAYTVTLVKVSHAHTARVELYLKPKQLKKFGKTITDSIKKNQGCKYVINNVVDMAALQHSGAYVLAVHFYREDGYDGYADVVIHSSEKLLKNLAKHIKKLEP